MLLNLLGTPSPVGELFLIAVLLYVVSALYFGYSFEAGDLDRSLDEASEEGRP